MKRNLPSVVRSDGTVEEFDADRIIGSLLRETSITREAAGEIASEMVVRLLSSGHKVVTAPFIREQLCSLLYGASPKWRFQYTRLGTPYHDFKRRYGEFFDRFEDCEDLGRDFRDRVIAALPPKDLVEIVRRTAKDYIGVRNKIAEYERRNGGADGG